MVDKRPHYVGVTSLSLFGGNFVLDKVHQGLVSVRCSELRGVRFSEVRNVLVFYGKINQGQVICPLYRGCPLFGMSVIRRFTVYCRGAVSGKYSNCVGTLSAK